MNSAEARRQLFLRRQAERGLKTANGPVPRAERGNTAPLSFAQERIWFLEQLHPENSAYIVRRALHLRGPVDVPALEAAFTEILNRHEVTRTVFEAAEGRPRQRVLPLTPSRLPVTDLSARPPADPAEAIRRWVRDLTARPVDLVRGPTVAAFLLRLRPEEHVLLVKAHHLVSDGWSMNVLLREWSLLYAALRAGAPSPLEVLPLQYADYAVWQREWFAAEVQAAQQTYWMKQLEGRLSPMELPTDRPRPAVERFHGSRLEVRVSPELTQVLRSFSRRHGVTLFMTLLAAFVTLLRRYSGQDDVLVGTPIANRNHVSVEGSIGLFANTLLLRTHVHDDPSFADLLQRVREVALGAYAHQDMPFEKLVALLTPPRDLSRNPIFQVMFGLQNEPPSTFLELQDVSAELLHIDIGTAILDLTLSLVDRGASLGGWWEFNTDLFDAESIARMTRHYLTLLESAVADPTRPLSALELMPAEERRQVLGAGQGPVRPDPTDFALHHLVERTAALTPERTAVVCGPATLSYGELNARANRLAHYLARLGVGPETRVGIFMERSLELGVALLAVLKAGGAYVPLDPEFPPSRLAMMVEDARLTVLLTQDSLRAAMLPAAASMVILEAAAPQVAGESAANPAVALTGDNLAYVIFTSGSTGRPKGVQIPHDAVVNFLLSMREEPGLQSTDVLLAVTTLSFDIAALEIFLPLVVGATVVLARRDEARDGRVLSRLLASSGATVMQATPATWRMLLEVGWSGSPGLTVLCGGEALPRDLAECLLPRCRALWNMYGPTETTIWSAVHPVASGAGPVSIGRSIAHTQLYVLDSNLQPVPLGVAGELCIGGRGLARGYLEQPDLTREKFVLVPWAPSGRLYRTGDVARARPDGTFEVLGRTDHQVKVRGFRIELGDVETALRLHPEVREAVVVARPDASGEKQLAAYVVPAPETTPAPRELRAFLQDKLPLYMIPSALHLLPSLPLTPNGKIDRRALPGAAPASAAPEPGYVPATTRLQKLLVEIWEEVLGTSHIGVTDSFFDRGGTSLQVMRLFARIEKVLSRALPLSTLFEAPTVEQLAASMEPGQAAGREPVVTLKKGDLGPPFFLVHDGEGETLLYLNLARHLQPGRPVYGLHPKSQDGFAILHTRIGEMVEFCIQQMRTVQPVGPYAVGGLCVGGIIAFEIARRLQLEGERVAMVAVMDAADVKAARRPGRIARHRLDSFSRGMRQHGEARPLERLRRLVATARRKASNLIAYEVQSRSNRKRVRRQIRLLRSHLDKHLPPPPALRTLAVRDVLGFAQLEFEPEGRFDGDILLFRAAQGEGSDLPYSEVFSDPLLGWGPRVNGQVRPYDMPGGHSSMLQEPHVREMARIVEEAIRRQSE